MIAVTGPSPSKSVLLAFFCRLCVLGATTPAVAQPAAEAPASRRLGDAELVGSLRAHMDRLVEEGRFSGAVMLAKDGEPLFQDAYGFANHAFGARNNLDTRFNLASVGKLFTTVSIMQLIERGKLSADDRLIDMLPDFPNEDDAKKITIGHLLSHRSGLTSRAGFRDPEPGREWNHRDVYDAIAGRPLQFEPGLGRGYSNAGYAVLGAVIERVSGMNYYDYINKNIFEPSGMESSGYFSMYDDAPNLAIGYTRGAVPGYPALPEDAPPRPAPLGRRGTAGGGPYSTLRDMLRFGEALRDDRLLTKDSLELILDGEYGPATGSVNGVRYLGHGGGTPGGSTYFEIYPDLGYTVVVLANQDEAATFVYERLRQQISGADLPRPVHLSAGALRRFEGRYEAASPATWGGRMAPGAGLERRPISVVADDEGLWVDLGFGAKRRFLPLSDGEFFDRDTLGPARLAFTKGAKGEVAGIDIKGSGPIMSTTATRLAP